ncbi:MAG: glycosyltransferase family 9 protein, partial [Deltaproteobacteria bacterium]|nr:glycosyltransferase family 9 protein [Deltaproteobacteria bacterium]
SFIDEVIAYRKGLLNFILLSFKLRRKRFDTALIMHGNDPDILPLAFFSGAAEVVGYRDSTSMPFLLTNALVLLPPDIHVVEKRLFIARAVGADTSSKGLILTVLDEERERVWRFLSEKGISEDDLIIGMHPGAARPYKCWPAERFAFLAKYLVSELGAKVVITGFGNEASLARKIREEAGDGILIAAGVFGLKGLSALIEKMDVYVTNDTGPMHMAFAVGTATVALFCPSDPKTIGPYGYGDKHEVISRPVSCNPCVTKRCEDPFCMKAITVEEVCEAVCRLVQRAKKVASA